MTSAKAKYFEAKIEESQKPQVKLREWDDEPVQPPIPEHKSSGESSAAGLKAKFELLANPPPPKTTMKTVNWDDSREHGQKKLYKRGVDPTKPPPKRTIADLS